MATKTLTLTEDHLKLVSFFLLEDRENELAINKKVMLTEQSHLLDDVSLILGLRGKMIPNTEDDAEGMAFPDDVEQYMVDTYRYVSENMYWIELLIHQYVLRGGVQPGTYSCNVKDKIWEKVQ